MKELMRSSARSACTYMNLRTRWIWPARRSVGVGEFEGDSSFGADLDLEGWRVRMRSS